LPGKFAGRAKLTGKKDFNQHKSTRGACVIAELLWAVCVSLALSPGSSTRGALLGGVR